MKTSSDKSPTDQEHKLGDWAGQTDRVQLTVRNISFGCLIYGGAYCLQYSVFRLCSKGRPWRFLRKAVFSVFIKVLNSCCSSLLKAE